MPKITELYAWVIADKDENDEGVPCVATPPPLPPGVMPLMGAAVERARSLRVLAQMAADMRGKPIRLVRSRGELEVIEVVQPRGVQS